MDQEKKHAVALMRYSAIAPLITGLSDEYESLTAFFKCSGQILFRTGTYQSVI